MARLWLLLALALSARPAPAMWSCPSWLANAARAARSALFPDSEARLRLLLAERNLPSSGLEAAFRKVPIETARSLYPSLMEAALRTPWSAGAAAHVLAADAESAEARTIATSVLRIARLDEPPARRESAQIFFVALVGKAPTPSPALAVLTTALEQNALGDDPHGRLLSIALDSVLQRNTLSPGSALTQAFDGFASRSARLNSTRGQAELLRYFVASASGSPIAWDGIHVLSTEEALAGLSPAGRVRLMEEVEKRCDPLAFAGLLYEQLINETDPNAWAAMMELFTAVIEGIAESDVVRSAFARSTAYRRYWSLSFDLRSRKVREFHRLVDSLHHAPGSREPAYLVAYNAQLQRLERAKAKIGKPL